ncbi:MAG: hypothetical protein Kow0099_31020 [Candidatus Abyssubacteria bacterium]
MVVTALVPILFLVALGPLRERGLENPQATHVVSRGDLVVDVLESGSVEASQSVDIRSEVEGKATIISIVPEGTVITEEDVKQGKVLVELDSSELREKAVQQEITVQSQLANYTDARESYAIQINQNESNLKAGELKVKFAKMDLEKYLGEEAAGMYVRGETVSGLLIDSPHIGGEALQKKRQLENEIALANEEAVRAAVKLEWTMKLYEKGYVTRDDLQADELALKRIEIEREQAETALALFTQYELPKEAERLKSDYEEAVKELERIEAKNRAELSKAEARLKSTEAAYKYQRELLRKLQKQIENCTIEATQPGLVVYAKGAPWRDQRIEEGAQVIEQQEIIKIPNTSSMTVKVKIHESVITRIREGQRALVTFDSMPDEEIKGVVSKVAVLPDSQSWWLNPDLKVYLTDVSLLGVYPNLKPGMSAKVRIIIGESKDVLMVPLQAVATKDKKSVCFVMTPSGPEMRVVETGDYNENFMEIKNGLREGEKVVLNAQTLAGYSGSSSSSR